MTKEEIFQFIKENPLCFLATVEGDTPHVRAMGTFKVDDRGILIQLSTPKDLYKQLVKNPKVELCYNNLATGTMIRIGGTAEFLPDKAVKEEVLVARPFLKSLADEQGLDVIQVFRVANGKATVWTKAENMAPKTYIDL